MAIELGTYLDDLDGDNYVITCDIDGTDMSTSTWCTYTDATQVISCIPPDNTLAYTHPIDCQVDDQISIPISFSFNYVVIPNLPIVANMIVDDMSVIVGNSFSVPLDINTIFTDPEGMPFSWNVRLTGQAFPPVFLSVNFLAETLTGFPTINDVNEYNL